MSLQEAFDPQISQIYADGSGHCLAPAASLVSLDNLRNLRMKPRFPK
ncbi:hypothetical protein [Sulfuritalea hydrogenivorans]|nr:hypothetical protein [Sulfuritalea hydrogenivorans]